MSLQQDELLIIYWWLLIHSDEYCLTLSINTVMRHSRKGGCLFECSPGRITQLHKSSWHLHKMENPVILRRNHFFFLWIFSTLQTDSQGTWNPFSISLMVIFIVTWKKERENLIFPSLLLKSFQSRIDGQLFLCQLHDKWIFLPEYLQYWAESY